MWDNEKESIFDYMRKEKGKDLMERVEAILKRITSQHLAKLWLFYRDVFATDEECLEFVYEVLRGEPEMKIFEYVKDNVKICNGDSEDAEIDDKVFIPRRMLNAVERMVSTARDMEIIRHGKDVFKVVFIVTCVETLQKLAGRDKDENGKSIGKKNLLFDFFEEYTLDKDKQYIASRFEHNDEEYIETQEDPFNQFIGVINEFRNCAAHEGEYWKYCFSHNSDDYPMSFSVKLDLERFSGADERKKEHRFTTEISYSEFEKIFIRTCVAFIKRYIKEIQNAINS